MYSNVSMSSNSNVYDKIYGNETVSEVCYVGHVFLKGTSVTGDVRVVSVTLQDTHVKGNVLAIATAIIKNSKIEGKLTCNYNFLTINDSQIDTIDLHCNPFSPKTNAGSSSKFVGVANAMPGSNVYINGVKQSTSQGVGSSSKFVGVVNAMPGSNIHTSIQSGSSDSSSMTQVLQLINCTVKNVIFAGGEGQVVLMGESKLTGTVTGGKIKGSQENFK